ncbi:MAG: hypothetical protein ACXW3Z_07995 [Limisphaerales bacterium]
MVTAIAQSEVESTLPTHESSTGLEQKSPDSRDWSVQVGAGFITKQNIGEVFSKGPKAAEGDSEGEIYSLTLGWVAHRFEIPFRDAALRPQFETYATLTLVDESGQGLFPDYNAGVGFRWIDFPWDRWVDTSFFMGIGLSYSSRVFTVDRERHPGEDRSHLKFDWPVQLTFALPRWPEHQLVLFNDHQSGGRILDRGGVNSFGLGYRLEF